MSLSPDVFSPESLSGVESWAIRLSVVGGAVFALLAFGKKTIKGIKNFYHLATRVHQIVDELSPNGGSSLKDAITRIETNQKGQLHRERAVLQISPVPMFELNTRGDFVWANRAFLNLCDKDLDELTGRGWENCVEQDLREELSAEVTRTIQGSRDLEFTTVFTNGHRPVRILANVMRSDTGVILGWFGTVKMSGNIFSFDA